MTTSFERRKAAYLAFVEKQTGPLEEPPSLRCGLSKEEKLRTRLLLKDGRSGATVEAHIAGYGLRV
jgi:hypothetical protein